MTHPALLAARRTATRAPTPAPIDITWLGCDAATGRVITELPGLHSATISRRICAATTATATLDLRQPPKGWLAATQPARALLVCVADGTPVWAGIVWSRRGGTADELSLTLRTPESYWGRRYVGDHTWSQQDIVSVVAAGLVADAADDGIVMDIDAVASGHLADRTYHDVDDATVLDRLTELAGTSHGPEWTVDVGWADSGQDAVTLSARIRAMLGTQTEHPGAWWWLPGSIQAYSLSEDWSTGRAATLTRAYGAGVDDARKMSDDHVATDLIAAGVPRLEHRWTPSTSITNMDTLDAHAAATLAAMEHGAMVWTLTGVDRVAPRLGAEWELGATIGWAIDDSPRHERGDDPDPAVVATGRAWGWQWDTDSGLMSPILVQEG